MSNLFKKIIGYCPHCNKYFRHPKRRRINTCYEEDEKNYTYECRRCYKRTLEYFDAMWSDYNSGRF